MTAQDVAQDAREREAARVKVPRGRSFGEANGLARLSADDVAQIRAALLDGWTDAALARRYGVARQTVQRVREGSTWPDPAWTPRPPAGRGGRSG